MKKNVILSTVAATVVTGVLMMSGCGSNSKAPTYNAGQTASGQAQVFNMDANGNLKTATSATAKGNGGGFSNSQVTIKAVRDCVDANKQPKPCEEVCTAQNPCKVTIKSACSNTDKNVLDYTKHTDIIGAWDAYNNTGNADVVAVRNDAGLVPAYSGVVNIDGSKGMGTCGFDFNTFIVCALTKDGLHAWNTSTNSAGYALVLVEYADGTSEWKKVDITRKSNGSENDQPFIELLNLEGKVPAKITVFSVLKKGALATGSSGSTGATL